jgi:hypothetical protein
VAQGSGTIVWIERLAPALYVVVGVTCYPATIFATSLVASGFIDLQSERELDICKPRDCQNIMNVDSAIPPVAQQNCFVLYGV